MQRSAKVQPPRSSAGDSEAAAFADGGMLSCSGKDFFLSLTVNSVFKVCLVVFELYFIFKQDKYKLSIQCWWLFLEKNIMFYTGLSV